MSKRASGEGEMIGRTEREEEREKDCTSLRTIWKGEEVVKEIRTLEMIVFAFPRSRKLSETCVSAALSFRNIRFRVESQC